jgi:plastocyanin
MCAAVIAIGLTAAACAKDAAPNTEQTRDRAGSGPSADVVTLEGLSFTPKQLTVAVGTTVRWANQDPVQHTVTSGTKGTEGVPGVSKGKNDRPDGVFDHELVPDASFSFTFDKPGTYDYFCRIHGGMTGTVVVK